MTRPGRNGFARFLNVILTILMWSTLILALFVAGTALVGTFLIPKADIAAIKIQIGGLNIQGMAAFWTGMSVTVIALLVYWWVIVLFRNFFRAIARGEAFTDENVRRLNMLGGFLVVAKVVSMGGHAHFIGPASQKITDTITFKLPDGVGGGAPSWLVIIAVFALAEAFRQGAKLHAESQLTV